MKNLLKIQLNLGTLETLLQETLQELHDFEDTETMRQENSLDTSIGRTYFARRTRNLRVLVAHTLHELTIDKNFWEDALRNRTMKQNPESVAV